MRSLAASLLVASVLAAGCGDSGSGSGSGSGSSSAEKAPSAQATVDIASFKYKPVEVTVRKGGRVRWTNSDSAAHTATADDRSFDTQTIDKGAAGMVTFTSTGRFAYHCDFHPFMKATVVVR